ncbi:THO complex subunit 2 isoform X2 [Amborella trichopoda]|uniref:THO complex subunit 2 isoform X2 n=1 Tax=Amborella trichopoda TaxID=13333 RepID=UPI0005D2DE87|nr:THO complex subunit 2 isoform X2 [Amborella trichopoda]|eukprot:XP_011629407.1 THO complex subunit 2 isoform X2 [Amborella trichopoda]
MSPLGVERKYFTDECLREWKAPSTSFKLPVPVPSLRFLYELCWTMVRGDLPFAKCKTALDSVEFSDKRSKDELGSVFADIIAHMGQDLTLPGDYRTRLVKLAKWLMESGLVPLRLFQERCEEEFLWECEMIKIKAQDLKAKEVRVNTRLLYQQTKFNLLREESEGYAKLVTLLCQVGPETSTRKTSDAVISSLKSLIGHFDLDPNRVFDVVLECFELQPDNTIFFDLIPIFPKSHASQILGFKFQYYQRMEVNDPVPHGLYRLAAVLVKSEFIDLDSICAHLLPKDEEAFELYETFSTKQFEEANKIGKINLAAIGKELMDDEKQGDVTIDLFTALDMENEAVAERSPELEKNQYLGLLNGFLDVDDWFHAHILFDRLAPLNPVAHIQICNGLFRAIEKSISSTYDIINQSHLQILGGASGSASDAMELSGEPPCQSTSVVLPKELFQMLACAGPYLHRNVVLLQKVCRVLRKYYQSAQELVDYLVEIIPRSSHGDHRDPRLQLKEARSRVEEALGSCILPSLQLIPANPAVGQEIWELMSLLPYEVRYRLYGEWEKDDESLPLLFAARQTARLDTRRILKRLAKENLKQLGRMVAKIAHGNPMTVLRTIVHQIEAYRDMIAPVVDAFKYLTQLEYDILEYVVIERLAQGGREKLKDDGLNLSDWLQSLASFWGSLCKKYPSMELRGLFQYLVNQLKKGNGIELILLQELVQQMANVQYTENMSEEQLDAMAGGETLRYQATSFGITKNNKALVKSTNRLRDSLLAKEEPKLAIPLLLLIAQHRALVVINADAPYIKMVSEQFDRCHGTLLQYVEFLSNAVTPSTAYAHLIPSLDDLIHKYCLDPEVAFLIYRPVMRLFKCLRSSDTFWPSEFTREATQLNADKESDHSFSSSEMVLDLGSPRKPITWSDLLGTVRSMLPSKAWNSLSPELYATFWGLTLYDLYVPKNRYESEIAKQHAALKNSEEQSDNSNSAIAKRKKDKERIQEILDRLTNELHKHEENVASVRKRLAREKDIWLTSCPDTLKINMEFLQRCIFPRCVFSMPDAVYCAMFVHTLHSLGTPFFNTVNHIDVLVCKTLQPMICCCTEYEAGRLGRFLYETLKMAYYWKSDEAIYERECGNMPGFAVYYRDPNSQRVTFSQFIRVHWKWSGRITRLLIQCLESTEYMEIRNALILLTKISSVFPVTRKSGINLEKRVAKIKLDEREDLKVLATGVAAALAARKSTWVSEEEFGMGYVDLKSAAAPAAKPLTSNAVTSANNQSLVNSQIENGATRNVTSATQASDGLNSSKDHMSRSKPVDGRLERADSVPLNKIDAGQAKSKGSSVVNTAEAQINSAVAFSGTSRSPGLQKNADEPIKGSTDESMSKVVAKLDTESRPLAKRGAHSGSLTKQSKADVTKDDSKSGKPSSRVTVLPLSSTGERDGLLSNPSVAAGNGSTASAPMHGKAAAATNIKMIVDSGVAKQMSQRVGAEKDSDEVDAADGLRALSSRPSVSPFSDEAAKFSEKQLRRSSPSEELDRHMKRRKGEMDAKDGDGLEARFSDRERDKSHPLDYDRTGSDEQVMDRPTREKLSERFDRDHRPRSEDVLVEKARDRSMERHGRERSVDRGSGRSFDRAGDKSKDERGKEERGKPRYSETPVERSHPDDRFHGQSLPPPPPLPPNIVPQSVAVSRRDEEQDKRVGSARHMQRLSSPRHEEKEKRRSEDNSVVSLDDAKHRREEEFRERKRDDRDTLSLRVDERDREKGNQLKDDSDAAASKRRRIKKDHIGDTAGEYPLMAPSPLPMGMSQSYDNRDRGERKGAVAQRATYMEEPLPRVHAKETPSKITRRDNEQMHERDWDDEKRQRVDTKRKHRK